MNTKGVQDSGGNHQFISWVWASLAGYHPFLAKVVTPDSWSIFARVLRDIFRNQHTALCAAFSCAI
eukprot:1138770-Pelagomonas_calceolata.AAC.11